MVISREDFKDIEYVKGRYGGGRYQLRLKWKRAQEEEINFNVSGVKKTNHKSGWNRRSSTKSLSPAFVASSKKKYVLIMRMLYPTWSAVLRVKNMRRGDRRDFWFYVNIEFEPRTVYESNHYRFIYFEDHKYFLSDNVLLKFPGQHNMSLALIAREEGPFAVDDNKDVKPYEYSVHLPHFDS